jgi:hypothetical protein
MHGMVVFVSLLAFSFFLMTSPVSAQAPSKAVGELASAALVKINGYSAVSGTTIFSGNRVGTAQEGRAIINLGKLGRVELGAETDLTLRFSTGQLSGELHSGRTLVSAPAGVVISISTAKGLVTTDGRQAAALTVKVDSRRAQVISHRGEARVGSGSKVGRVEEGEEIAIELSLDSWKRRRPLLEGSRGVSGGASADRLEDEVMKPVAATTLQNTLTFFILINTGINHSLRRLAASKGRVAYQVFETTITCCDHFRNSCRRRGGVSPLY